MCSAAARRLRRSDRLGAATVKSLLGRLKPKSDGGFFDRITAQRKAWDEMLDKHALSMGIAQLAGPLSLEAYAAASARER